MISPACLWRRVVRVAVGTPEMSPDLEARVRETDQRRDEAKLATARAEDKLDRISLFVRTAEGASDLVTRLRG